MQTDRFWAGIDLGQEEAALCVTNALGDVLFEQMLEATPDAIFDALRSFPSNRLESVGIEAGGSAHIARKLRLLGLPVAELETRKASKVLQLRRNKTDINDARGLADIVRLGPLAVSQVRPKSLESRQIRMQLTLRQQLIKQRVAGENAIRSILRDNGVKAKSTSKAARLRPAIEAALSELIELEGVDLRDEVLPLLAVCESIRRYSEAIDKRLLRKAREHAICQRFLDVPGVGPICALSFFSAIDDPDRFTRTEDVASYLGLTPRIRQSGRQMGRPRISRMGNAMTRSHLTQGAEVLLSICRKESKLRDQALALRQRIGFRRARIAVARKLSIVLLSLWKSGTTFNPGGQIA